MPEMAEIVGVTRQTVYFWESGQRKPTGDRLLKYAAALRACLGAE